MLMCRTINAQPVSRCRTTYAPPVSRCRTTNAPPVSRCRTTNTPPVSRCRTTYACLPTLPNHVGISHIYPPTYPHMWSIISHIKNHPKCELNADFFQVHLKSLQHSKFVVFFVLFVNFYSQKTYAWLNFLIYILIISKSKCLVYIFVQKAIYCTMYRIFYVLHNYTVYQHFLATKNLPHYNPNSRI